MSAATLDRPAPLAGEWTHSCGPSCPPNCTVNLAGPGTGTRENDLAPSRITG